MKHAEQLAFLNGLEPGNVFIQGKLFPGLSNEKLEFTLIEVSGTEAKKRFVFDVHYMNIYIRRALILIEGKNIRWFT
jgi:hypothetical protein